MIGCFWEIVLVVRAQVEYLNATSGKVGDSTDAERNTTNVAGKRHQIQLQLCR